jgi:hypothetical protein
MARFGGFVFLKNKKNGHHTNGKKQEKTQQVGYEKNQRLAQGDTPALAVVVS